MSDHDPTDSRIQLALTDAEGTIDCIFLLDPVFHKGSSVVSDCGEYQMVLRPVPFVSGKKYRDKEWLVEQYINKQMTMQEIGDMFAVSPMTIYTWLNKHDIPTRGRGRR